MNRRLKIIFGIGVPLGILLIVVKNYNNIEDGVFWKQYLILGAVVVAAAVIINCLYQMRFIRQLSSISKRLANTGDLDVFIEELERLLVRTRSRSEYRKTLILINLSYAYSKKKEYAKGLAILDAIDSTKVKGINQIVYLLNMVSFHFYLKNYEEVLHITEENAEAFSKFSKHPHIGFPMAVNSICYNIAKGNIEQAKELLEEAEQKWNEEEMQDEWEYLAEIIAEYDEE